MRLPILLLAFVAASAGVASRAGAEILPLELKDAALTLEVKDLTVVDRTPRGPDRAPTQGFLRYELMDGTLRLAEVYVGDDSPNFYLLQLHDTALGGCRGVADDHEAEKDPDKLSKDYYVRISMKTTPRLFRYSYSGLTLQQMWKAENTANSLRAVRGLDCGPARPRP